MIHVAGYQEEEKRVGLKEIAGATESPEAFTAKILQQLVKAGLLKSYKGPTGGFELSGSEIKLIDVVAAIDGRKLMDECVLGFSTCSGANPCPVHEKFVPIRELLNETLLSTNILDPALLLGSKDF